MDDDLQKDVYELLKMTIELIELVQLSGSKARFYTVILNGEDESLYTKFTKQYINEYSEEIREMMT